MINEILWSKYHGEVLAAKEEYDKIVGPFMLELQRIKKKAWRQYIRRITQAEIFLKEEKEV